MRSLWTRALLALLAVWLIAGGIMLWARHTRPTPESVARYLAEHPLDGRSPRDRERLLRTVADQLNQLPYEQRRELRMGRKLDGFFRSLNPDEQSRFLDATLPTGFRQMMDALNRMEPEKRKTFVDRALSEMKKDEGGGDAPGQDDPNVRKIVQEGLRSFYNDASADVKMDFAPLLEQMQKNLQGR